MNTLLNAVLIRRLRFLFLSMTMLALSACGFHLRGQYQLPEPLFRLFIQTTEPYNPFVLRLERVLTKMHVVIVPTAADAKVVLVILGLNNSQSLVSSSTTSQVNTYALSYTMRFSLTSPGGTVLVGPESVSASQNYTISSSQAISGSSQEQQLNDQLYQDVIYQLFNQLSSKKVKAALSPYA